MLVFWLPVCPSRFSGGPASKSHQLPLDFFKEEENSPSQAFLEKLKQHGITDAPQIQGLRLGLPPYSAVGLCLSLPLGQELGKPYWARN